MFRVRKHAFRIDVCLITISLRNMHDALTRTTRNDVMNMHDERNTKFVDAFDDLKTTYATMHDSHSFMRVVDNENKSRIV